MLKSKALVVGFTVVTLLLTSACGTGDDRSRPYEGPYIDVHMHSDYPIENFGPPPLALCSGGWGADLRYDNRETWADIESSYFKTPRCDSPVWSAMTNAEVEDGIIAEMHRLNVTGVVIGDRATVDRWKERLPGQVIWAHFPFGANLDAAAFDDVEVLAEVAYQYLGIPQSDQRTAAMWAQAAKLDIPVGAHIGPARPGQALLGGPTAGFRASLSSPLALEEVLSRHPNLRVYAMHAGWPFRDDMIAMLYAYPGLYVDTGMMHYLLPREEYYAYYQALIRAGFIDRIMFSSDVIVWPEIIEEGIKAINEMPFLTYEQKKAILHDNAARFFRIEEN